MNISENELIARFHGWKHKPTPKGKGKAAFNSDFFEYHKNWSWIMPVVRKISTLDLGPTENDSATEKEIEEASKQKYACCALILLSMKFTKP